MTPAPDTELQNPFEFLGDISVSCSNEATLGGLLDGGGHQKDQAVVRRLEFSALPTHPPQKGEGMEIELMTDHAYLRKPPLKSQ